MFFGIWNRGETGAVVDVVRVVAVADVVAANQHTVNMK